jgi:hypothetical protein
MIFNYQLVFFTDGARAIHDKIENMFSFTKYKIILDWFHVVKKFKEFLSMAFKSRELRNDFLRIIFPMLWYGNVDGAINALKNVDKSKVKNATKLDELIKYLERVRNYIPNYALRKKLGLRNSSNLVEKANDVVVAKRQKNNGMSWSVEGSTSLATVTCVRANGNLKSWTENKSIPFKLIPYPAKDAAPPLAEAA